MEDIFFSCLREHGFPVTPADTHAAIADFGAAEHQAITELVAVAGGKVAGFASVGPAPGGGHAEIYRVFVARGHRGRGIGSRLIAEAVDIAKERGFTKIILDTHHAFVTACGYYERHGWMLVSSVAGPDGDLLRYSRDLRSSGVVRRM